MANSSSFSTRQQIKCGNNCSSECGNARTAYCGRVLRCLPAFSAMLLNSVLQLFPAICGTVLKMGLGVSRELVLEQGRAQMLMNMSAALAARMLDEDEAPNVNDMLPFRCVFKLAVSPLKCGVVFPMDKYITWRGPAK